MVYRILGYRKKVVRENLKLALPHLTDSERLTIERKFYTHMCDLFLEMIKTMTISEKEIRKRFVFTNIEVFKELEQKEKSIIIMLGHYASWEWMVSMAMYTDSKAYAVYTKVENKYFDRLVKKIRAKFDGHLIVTKDTIRELSYNKVNKIQSYYGFASDQSPVLHKAFYWDKFMGIEVPVHTGGEMLAKRLDLNMIYVAIKKVKRGHYEATFEKLVDNPKDYPDYEISSIFLRKLEQQILETPEHYLWTHKRWKHAGKKP